MNDRGQEFWAIVQREFPDYAHDQFAEENAKERTQRLLEAEENDARWERITAASYDENIWDYFQDGIGSEESLIARLQREYELLSENEAIEAIDKAIGQQSEVIGYGDEA